MRVHLVGAGLLLMLSATTAQAATVVIITDPMTLERRTMVLDTKGPDRVLLCAMPPAMSGCRDVTPRRR
ncbi:hypothetical protein GCM10022280_21210 [Sphingomonas swuensis]|uniref:Uncharacterized protein n=1 Tax=Sphingomonas swuensis TaxID=977800 RepID=A0ABP7T4B6_9SPHN